MDEDMSEIFEKLKSQLDEFAKLKEEMEANVKSAVSTVPTLEEQKAQLQEKMRADGEKIKKMQRSISRLESDLQRKEEKILEIDEQLEFLTDLSENHL